MTAYIATLEARPTRTPTYTPTITLITATPTAPPTVEIRAEEIPPTISRGQIPGLLPLVIQPIIPDSRAFIIGPDGGFAIPDRGGVTGWIAGLINGAPTLGHIQS